MRRLYCDIVSYTFVQSALRIWSAASRRLRCCVLGCRLRLGGPCERHERNDSCSDVGGYRRGSCCSCKARRRPLRTAISFAGARRLGAEHDDAVELTGLRQTQGDPYAALRKLGDSACESAERPKWQTRAASAERWRRGAPVPT